MAPANFQTHHANIVDAAFYSYQNELADFSQSEFRAHRDSPSDKFGCLLPDTLPSPQVWGADSD